MGVTAVLLGMVVWMLILRPKQTLASFVPDHASWYLEVEQPLDVLKNVQKGIRLYSDPGLTFFAEWQEGLGYVQQLLKSENLVSQYLQKTTIGISAHVLTGKEAGYVFYVPMNGAQQEKLFGILQQFYGRQPGYKYSERQYMNRRIVEITFKKEGTNFSIASAEGTLFGSFSGFLVEEVVRKSGMIFKPNFAEKLKKDPRYTGLSAKPLRLFFNLARASDFFYQYLTPTIQGLRLSSAMGEGVAFGFSQPNGFEWVSEGYLLNENPKEKGKHERPLQTHFADYMPGGEAIWFHLSLAEVWSVFPDKAVASGPSPQDLSLCLEPEVLLAWLEGEGLKKYDRLLISKVKDPRRLEEWMASHHRKTSEAPYTETFGGVVIKQHSNPNLGSLLGGSLLADWVPVFYAFHNGYMLISDDVETLRRSIRDAGTHKPSQLSGVESSYFAWNAHINRCLPMMLESSAGVFKKNFAQWIPLFKGLSKVSITDNGEDENPSLKLTLSLRPPVSGNGMWEETHKQFIDSTLISAPVRLEWKAGRQHFWAVQDKKLNVHVFGEGMKHLFDFQLFGPWVGKPQVLDNGGNASCTFLFQTAKSIRLVNKTGQEVKPSPLLLPDSSASIEHARAVDYDQSFHHRILMDGRYGEVYMADMEGKFLPGWNPYTCGVPLSFAPKHLRIGDKDLILMLDRNGKLMVVNRKAEMQPGFPTQFAGRTNQPIFTEAGLTLKTSYVYALSELGQMEKINLEGKSESRIQLFRPDKDTRFQLCIDQRQKTFAVARITGTHTTVFDQGYRPILDFESSTPQVVVQHFHFGASNKIYAIVDIGASQCHLFNETGQQITPEPIETDQPVDIIQQAGSADVFELVKAFKNKLSTVSFVKD